MINKLNKNQVSEGTLNTRKGALVAAQIVNRNATQGVDARNVPEDTRDASLRVSFDNLIEQARQTPTEGESVVAHAKAMITSGLLDTPENTLKAAQNIVKFGV